jgi:hypothetical protein
MLTAPMKTSALSLVFLLFAFYSYSQETAFVKSVKPTKNYDYKYHVMYYLTQGDEFIAVHCSKKTLLLEKFNSKTMKPIKEQEVKFSEPYSIFERLISIENRHFLIYSTYQKKEKKSQLRYKEINFEECTFHEQSRLIFESSGEIPMGSSQ